MDTEHTKSAKIWVVGLIVLWVVFALLLIHVILMDDRTRPLEAILCLIAIVGIPMFIQQSLPADISDIVFGIYIVGCLLTLIIGVFLR